MIGWDVGGAHLKAARVNTIGIVDAAIQVPCALWRGLDELRRALDIAIAQLGSSPSHAVTMTGEMVDLFPDRNTGVMEIARIMQQRFAGGDVKFYCGEDRFVAFDGIANHATEIASANWRATAQMVAKFTERCVFLDIGSTTTDVIAVENHQVRCKGFDDFSRLVAGELVYCGVVRTPLMALADRVKFCDDSVPVIAEHFATTADVFRLLDQLPDGVDQHPTADGAEKTRLASARRIARMVGRDEESATTDDWCALAKEFRAAQLARITAAIDLAGCGHSRIVGAGIGDFLAREIAESRGWEYQSFAEVLGVDDSLAAQATHVAPAVAVALIALNS